MTDLSLLATGAITAPLPGGQAGQAAAVQFDLQGPETRFADWLAQGVGGLSQRMGAANALAAQFAMGADLPPHQVVLALEDARLSFQLALQVRTRLLEGYQELMRMQL
jgi:flagellar hook-basal body complex protein FliE